MLLLCMTFDKRRLCDQPFDDAFRRDVILKQRFNVGEIQSRRGESEKLYFKITQ